MVRRKPLDPTTAAAIDKVIAAARRRGANEAEALHKAGLVFDHRMDVEIQRVALDRLLDRMYTVKASGMMTRTHGSTTTPAGMYNVITEFIEEYKQKLGET